MSSTLIDVRAVISCSGRIRRIKSTVSGIQSSFRTTKGRIDDSIMDAELASTLSQINNHKACTDHRKGCRCLRDGRWNYKSVGDAD